MRSASRHRRAEAARQLASEPRGPRGPHTLCVSMQSVCIQNRARYQACVALYAQAAALLCAVSIQNRARNNARAARDGQVLTRPAGAALWEHTRRMATKACAAGDGHRPIRSYAVSTGLYPDCPRGGGAAADVTGEPGGRRLRGCHQRPASRSRAFPARLSLSASRKGPSESMGRLSAPSEPPAAGRSARLSNPSAKATTSRTLRSSLTATEINSAAALPKATWA